MAVPAAPGHVWKPTSDGVLHQFPFDQHNYDDDGLLKAKCGKAAAPILEQPHCPKCLVQSPAHETADRMEQQIVESFGAALTEPNEVLRDR